MKNEKIDLFKKIGFMQGRLSAPIDNQIQSFPWETWQDEFAIGHKHNFNLIEWTIDTNKFNQNPLLTPDGQDQILKLIKRYNLEINSLTGDCFMQSPFWKNSGNTEEKLKLDFLKVIHGCINLNIKYIVVPLVDNGRLESKKQEASLVNFLMSLDNLLDKSNTSILFESDFSPLELSTFINQLNPKTFGINYDIGNSASLGFDPKHELEAYGNRVKNVHVKDRLLHGTTVPLGTGNANFPLVFSELKKIKYEGNYILQTARSSDDNHLSAILEYREMLACFLSQT